jgi:organic radical activating enzyme
MQLEPQHVDRNVSPTEYKQFGDKLLVTSVFHTIQGEGVWAGYVATFTRLAGCNFGAKGAVTSSATAVTESGEIQVPDTCRFCDTFFSFAEGTPLSFDEVHDRIVKAQGATPCNRIVITGGEPMIQKNVVAFTEYLNNKGYSVQFETNGAFYLPIPASPSKTIENIIVCSPKMGAANKYSALRPDVFARADCLKFVVEREGKFNYIPDYAFEFAATGKPVYVSPINVYLREVRRGEVPCFFTEGLYDLNTCRDNYKYAAELSMKYGFILNLQKHLFLGLE